MGPTAALTSASPAPRATTTSSTSWSPRRLLPQLAKVNTSCAIRMPTCLRCPRTISGGTSPFETVGLQAQVQHSALIVEAACCASSGRRVCVVCLDWDVGLWLCGWVRAKGGLNCCFEECPGVFSQYSRCISTHLVRLLNVESYVGDVLPTYFTRIAGY